MHNVDLSKLSAEGLDQLILDAGQKRAAMQPEFPKEAPKEQVQAFVNPAWHCSMTDTGTLFQVLHAGYGWLAFHLPPQDRIMLMSALLNQCLIAGPPQNYKPDAVTVPGGALGSSGSNRIN